MLILAGSVGKDGQNLFIDVSMVQYQLNRFLEPGVLPPLEPLAVDGYVGSKTIDAIKEFQQRIVKVTPTGRVEPGSATLQRLDGPVPSSPVPDPPGGSKEDMICVPTGHIPWDFLFPFKKKPNLSWTGGTRFFGAGRDNGKRKHAGNDLVFPQGTAIHAIADGVKVKGPMQFTGPPKYSVTHEVQIKHGPILVRYGEILPGSYTGGNEVTKGQVIAEVGALGMLHLEIYTNPDDLSPLTDKSPGMKKLFRRKDITDPAPYLNVWQDNRPS
jgi:murein DD-endopeptidase MepM/ murein hydrolase activator NlpD